MVVLPARDGFSTSCQQPKFLQRSIDPAVPLSSHASRWNLTAADFPWYCGTVSRLWIKVLSRLGDCFVVVVDSVVLTSKFLGQMP